jgi:glutaredoxin
MKEVKLFHLTGCPYCIRAKNALKELIRENEAYGKIAIHWIEEREEAETAEQYDYYYVPTVFFGTEKLYEADPSQNYEDIKACLKNALDTVLSEQNASL